MNAKRIVLFAVLALVLVAAALVYPKLDQYRVHIPEYQRPAEIVWAQQNWSEAQRLRFHHTPQGTRLMPYAWFMALEQPCFSLSGCDLFSDTAYLSRFGFLPGKKDPEMNPDGLPVGFAIDKSFRDPQSNQTYAVAGLTCAACHTGEMYYGKYAVQIDGAPAMIELAEFEKAIGLALGFTQKIPFRYGRFEQRVLGPSATEEQKAALKKNFDAALAQGLWELQATTARKIYDYPAGFARTDALTRIGNQVFAIDMQNADNFAVSQAAVRFPQIWDASWLNWVQYNSSIADPLVRNIGESLGVRAAAKLYGPDAAQLANSVNVDGLKTLEDLLAGPAPFEGLSSPKWPSVFPPLDQAKVARGAGLYKQHCESCHLPSIPELLADLKEKEPKYWWQNRNGARFLRVKDVPMDAIGTDPHEAADFKARTADSGALNLGRISAREGLDKVTRGMANSFYTARGLTPDQQLSWSGRRDPKDLAVRDALIYKARPLNGIWAAGLYLHNGSVPSLYALLSPVSERPVSFWLGSKEYDPVNAGYETKEIKGGTRFDITGPGNSNKGHEFNDGPRGNGTIGPLLPPDDRRAIIEYLKSL